MVFQVLIEVLSHPADRPIFSECACVTSCNCRTIAMNLGGGGGGGGSQTLP